MTISKRLWDKINKFLSEKRNGHIYFNQTDMRSLIAAPELLSKALAEKELLVSELGKQLQKANKALEKANQHNTVLDLQLKQAHGDIAFEQERIRIITKQYIKEKEAAK